MILYDVGNDLMDAYFSHVSSFSVNVDDVSKCGAAVVPVRMCLLMVVGMACATFITSIVFWEKYL